MLDQTVEVLPTVEAQEREPTQHKAQWMGSRWSYPFQKMAIGDWFMGEFDQKCVSAAAVHHAKKYGKKFRTRSILQTETKLVQVHRIE